MDTIEDIRRSIDEADAGIMELFAQRMRASARIALCKKAQGFAVFDAAREKEKLRQAEEMLPEELKAYGASLCALLMDLSKDYQRKIAAEGGDAEASLFGVFGHE